MADIEIMELRAFEPRCGESGPIETSVFFAMAWEESHNCVAIRMGTESGRTDAVDTHAHQSDAAALAVAS
jgi:hypothetical protein